MKIQCDACERAEAAVLCCADEAVLCWACDHKVHAANKLARKHHRLPLLLPCRNSSSNTAATAAASSSQHPCLPPSLDIPTCDTCKEKAGYLFCLEDRALLCPRCDMVTHTASPYVVDHRRFLVTGVRVALHHNLTDQGNIDNYNHSYSDTKANNSSSKNPLSSLASIDSAADKKLQGNPIHYGLEGLESSSSEWSWMNELFADGELEQLYGQPKPGSSS